MREPERELPEEEGRLNFIQITKEVFANRPFRIGAAIYVLAFSAVDIITSVFVWFLIYYMQLEPPIDSLVLAAVLGVAFLSMPFHCAADAAIRQKPHVHTLDDLLGSGHGCHQPAAAGELQRWC